MNIARLLVPRRRKVDGNAYLWLLNTCIGLLGSCLTAAPQAVKQRNSPQPCSPEGLQCLSSLPGKAFCSHQLWWWCLGDVSLFSYEKQQVQKQKHACVRSAGLVGQSWALRGPGPPEGHRLLSCAGGVSPTLAPATPREFCCKKMKSACTASHPVPFVVKSSSMVSVQAEFTESFLLQNLC